MYIKIMFFIGIVLGLVGIYFWHWTHLENLGMYTALGGGIIYALSVQLKSKK